MGFGKELKQELKGLFLPGKEPRNSDRAERRRRRERDQLISAQENGPGIEEDYLDAAAGSGREPSQPGRSPDGRAPSRNRQPRELSDENKTPTDRNHDETDPNHSYVSELIRGDSSDTPIMKPVERKPLPSSKHEREVGSLNTELDRISRDIRRIQIEHPDIHFEWDIQPPCQLSDVEMVLRSLLGSYKSICEAHLSWEKKAEGSEVKYKALETKSKDDLNRRNNDMAEFVSTTNKEKARLETKLSAVENLFATRNLEHDERIKQIQGDFQSQKNALLIQAKKLNEQLEEVRRKNSSLERETSVMANKLAGIEQRHGEDIRKIRAHHQLELKSTVENKNRQVQQLRGEMAVRERDHEAKISQLKKGHEEKLITEKSAFGNELARREREYTANTTRMETEHRIKMRAKEEEMRRAQEDLLTQLRITAEQLAQAEEAKNKEIERICKEHTAEKARIEAEYQDKMLEKEDEVRGVREELHTQVRITDEQVDQAVEAKDKEIERIRKEHKYMITAKAEEIERIRKEHEAEIVTMREARSSDMVKMEEEHARDKIRLRKDVEDLKGALVKREHSKAMSDREAAQLFQDIGEEIDAFARVQWDEKYKLTWPFPEKSLQRSENIRRTKQYIIQNTLWIILYEKIFCTPFRVLGDEGKSLEGQWIEEFGRDGTSTGALTPRPTEESEKWRYDAMKRLVAAIKQPYMEGVPNQKVKRDHELTIKEAIEEISEELREVALISADEKQRLSVLVKKAAKMWLEIGQQRCRMFLLMSNSGKEPKRSRAAAQSQDSTLGLVVVPELRRFGNANGERLEKDELVAGCKGKFSIFVPS